MTTKDPAKIKEQNRRKSQRWRDSGKQNAYIKIKRDYIGKMKEENGCIDCLRKFPFYVLQFDHRPGVEKRFDISMGVASGRSLANVLEEVKKCDIVCANCHAIRTYIRQKAARDAKNESNSDS